LPGGGAPEIEVAKQLRKFAEGFRGREQLAINAFADALEAIPRGVAENAGLDPIDILVELRASHEKGDSSSGVDVFTGKIVNMYDKGVIEPLKVKTQAIKSAAEVAEMILRIDDVISAAKLEKSTPKGPSGTPGESEY
jgi:chaperonin GroEL (HSP60 family)